jgi:tetratricopeptide (TPR) repeat protein
VFGEDFLERLAAAPLAAELESACAQDLLAARILRRLPDLPPTPALREALEQPAPPGAAGGRSTSALLVLLADQALRFVSADGREALGAACLFTHLAHRDVLAGVAALEGRRLQNAFTELQWLGLLDAWDGDRYLGIPPRLQQPLAERLLTGPGYPHQRARMMRAYQTYLAQARPAAAAACQGAPALGWFRECRVTISPPAMAEVQRLGIERVNVAELAALLAEERDWESLRQLSDAAQAVQGVPEWADCLHLINHCLLGAGEALADPVFQATALCRIGAGLVASGRHAAAEPPLARALELIGPTSAWETMAEIYHWLSRCHLKTGRHEAAANLLLAAAELARQTGNAEHLAQALEGLAEAWRGLPDGVAEAERYLPARIEYLEQRGHGAAAARCRRLLGDLYQNAGRGREARAIFQDVEARFRHAQAAPEAYSTALRVAEGHALEGSLQDALATLRQARGQWPGQVNPAAEGRLLALIAQGQLDAGDSAASLEAYLEARRLLESCGDRDGVIRLLDAIGGLYFRLGDHAMSTRCYEERLRLQAPAPAR